MPFTFSHPLYAVPLHRLAPKWLSVTGLMLGSMAPDMEYFIAMEPFRTIGHTALGFLTLGMPLSIALAFVFHRIVKPVLPQFMPSRGGIDNFVQSRTADWQLRSVRDWAVFIVSLWIGFASHIFMDSWTHTGGFSKDFSFLLIPIRGERLYHWLQYALSLLGMAVPAAVTLFRYMRWRRSSRADTWRTLSSLRTRWLLWSCLIVHAAALIAAKGLFSGEHGWVGIVVVAPISAGLFGLFAASLLYSGFLRGKLPGAIASLSLIGMLIIMYKAVQVWLEHRLMSTMTVQHWLHFQQEQTWAWYGFYLAWAALLLLSCLLTSGFAASSAAAEKPPYNGSLANRYKY